MSQINVRNLSNENEDGAPDIVGVSTFSATSYFVPPVGNTQQRPTNPQGGDLRFNTDTASLEYFRGNTLGWTQIEMTSPDLGGGTGSNTGLGTRMLAGGGDTSSDPATYTNQIDFLTISTFGNGQDFGDLTTASTGSGGSASRTRGLFTNRRVAGSPAYTNEIEYVTIASTGNSQDFGDSTVANGYNRAVSSQIRSLGLAYSSINTINYVTIATTGNAVDFGDQTGVLEGGAVCASSTRGILAGGGNLANIDFVTIMTTGNAQDFGDLSATVSGGSGLSNSTRGVLKLGFQSTKTNAIEFITIATKSNSTDFGDAVNVPFSLAAGASPTRGIFAGGGSPASPYPKTNVIQKIEILTTGDAVDFGDLSFAASHAAGLTNGHGGL